MSFYDDASLILYPSGYKEDKIYSLKPTNGTGDLNFSRASSATRVNEQGLIEEASVLGSELIVNGDFATDSDWSKGAGWTIGGGVASCNGSQSGLSYLNQSGAIVSGKNYKVTYKVISISAGQVRVFVGGVESNSPRTTTGIYTEYITAGSTAFWLRGSSDFTGSIDNVSVKEVITSNVPRIDYTGGGCGSLLLEKQSTNLITYSESFDNAAFWALSNSASITSNNVTSPDGTLNADTLVAGASSSQVQGAIVGTSGAIYTVSMYIKRISGSGTVYLRAVENANTPITVTTEWTRVSLTVTSTSTTIRAGVALATSGDQVAIYGAQLEQSSYATSYIISNSGTATTRIADAASKTGISSLINSTEGVLYAEIASLTKDNDATVELTLSDGGTNNRIAISFTSDTNTLRAIIRVGGSNQFVNSETLSDITSLNKIAIKYKLNDFALWVNGVELATDTTGTTYSSGTLDRLNFDRADGGSAFYGKCQNLMVFPSVLTDDELADLTGAVHQTFNSLATFYGYTIL